MTRTTAAVFTVLLTPVLVHAADPRPIVTAALEKLMSTDERMEEFGFVRYGERQDFNADGSVKNRETHLVKRELREGFLITRHLERNGKPLSPAEQKKEESAIAKRLSQLKSVSPEQQRRKAEEARLRSEKEDAWIREIPDALECRLTGEETISGRPAFVIDCAPRPGYEPKNMRAKIFQKLRGRLWVDKADTELVKSEAEIFDEVNVAFGLAGHIDKGTRFYMERARVAEGVWMPVYQKARFSARILMVKSLNTEFVSRYSDYVRLRNAMQGGTR